MKATSYIQWIDETVRFAKKHLEKTELIQYMIGDTPEVNGSKAARDDIGYPKAYELSVYSTLLEVQNALHELHDEGSTAIIGMADPEDEETFTAIEGVPNVMIVGKGKLGADDREKLETMLEQLIKKLKEDK